MKKAYLYHLGNFLIVISIISSIIIYLPLFVPPKNVVLSDEVLVHGNSIFIPKISAVSQLILDVDPWRESEYMSALEKGIAHAKGTAYPWEKGTSFLFAHSTLPLWRMTRTNTPFLYLNKLVEGDQIIIDHEGKQIVFSVYKKKEVWPNEVNQVFSDTNDSLILQTCTPIGTSLKRLLVFAKKS